MPRLTREQSREITRERLRVSAIAEISANGFGAASIDRICEAAGFSRGAFYANFRSKEDLLLDIIRSHHDREIESWVRLLGSDTPLEALLPKLRQRFSAYLTDKKHIMFVTEVQLYAKRNQRFLARYNREFLDLGFNAEKVLEGIFRKAGKRPHRPVSVVANMMRGLLTGLVLDIGGPGSSAEQSAELLVQFLEDLLALGESA